MCKPAVHKLQKSSIPIQVDTGHKEYHCAGHDGGPLAPRPRSLNSILPWNHNQQQEFRRSPGRQTLEPGCQAAALRMHQVAGWWGS